MLYHFKFIFFLFLSFFLTSCVYTPTNEFGEKINIENNTSYEEYQYSQSRIKENPNLGVVRSSVKMLILNTDKNRILSILDTGDIFDLSIPHYSIDIRSRNMSKKTLIYNISNEKKFKIIINVYIYAQISSEQKYLSKVLFDSLRDKKKFENTSTYPECINFCKERPNIIPNDLYNYYIDKIVNNSVEKYFSNTKNRSVTHSNISDLFDFISDSVNDSESPLKITNIKFSHLFVTVDEQEEKVMVYLP